MIPSAASRRALFARLPSNAWLLLAFTMLSWGGNVVAAKIAVGHVSPMLIVCGRWAFVLLFLLLFGHDRLREDLRALRPHWVFVSLMGFVGFTLSNSMLYEGALFTSGVNIALIQAMMPIFVLLGAKMVFRARLGPARLLGAALTVAGILLIAAQGRLENLARLEFNRGDLIAIGGAALFAVFTLGLRNRPNVPAYVFFVGIALAAFVTSIPGLLIEMAAGATIWPDAKGLLVLLYVAIFTSLLGQIFFIRAVTLVGPGRAGMFQNLVPVIGALLSALVLREPFRFYDLVALGLVLAGIGVSERFGKS